MRFLHKIRLRYQLKRLELDHERGLIPSDQYRLYASEILVELRDYPACIDHCETYLIATSNDVVVGRLAYCYGEIGEWEKSADTYRTMNDVWKAPSDAFGFALAELRCGNHEKATEILEAAELAHGHRTGPTEALIRQLRSELYWAENGEND